MTKTAAARIAYSAKSTQNARQRYWAAVARTDAPAWLIMASAQALQIAEDGLIAACGYRKDKAREAEVAYINSLTA